MEYKWQVTILTWWYLYNYEQETKKYWSNFDPVWAENIYHYRKEHSNRILSNVIRFRILLRTHFENLAYAHALFSTVLVHYRILLTYGGTIQAIFYDVVEKMYRRWWIQNGRLEAVEIEISTGLRNFFEPIKHFFFGCSRNLRKAYLFPYPLDYLRAPLPLHVIIKQSLVGMTGLVIICSPRLYIMHRWLVFWCSVIQLGQKAWFTTSAVSLVHAIEGERFFFSDGRLQFSFNLMFKKAVKSEMNSNWQWNRAFVRPTKFQSVEITPPTCYNCCITQPTGRKE